MDPNDSRMKIVEQSMELVDKETMMICPYNEVHVIRAKRFQYHLMKCRKNFAGSDMVTCPFNARHVIPRPEQRHHINTCPDRTLIEQDANYNTKRQSTNDYEGNISVPKYIQDRPRIWESGEDWDDDIQTDFDQYDYPSAGSAGNPNFYPQPQTNGYRVPQEAAAPQALRQPRRPPGSVGQPLQSPAQHPLAAGPIQPAAQQPAQPPTGAYQPPAAPYQPPASLPSWANIAGIGRGIQRTTPLVGSAAPGIGRGAAVGRGVPGVGRGVVPPPPGFGRGHRGPAIAANIYNNAAAPGT